jgi:hypothetical protein
VSAYLGQNMPVHPSARRLNSWSPLKATSPQMTESGGTAWQVQGQHSSHPLNIYKHLVCNKSTINLWGLCRIDYLILARQSESAGTVDSLLVPCWTRRPLCALRWRCNLKDLILRSSLSCPP